MEIHWENASLREKIDGVLDEAAWRTAGVHEDFEKIGSTVKITGKRDQCLG